MLMFERAKSLLALAAALILFDAAITIIAVWGMGAPELNPIVDLLGFWGFMLIKIVFSAIALVALWTYYLERAPICVYYGAIVLCVWFGVVCLSNVCRIIVAVMG